MRDSVGHALAFVDRALGSLDHPLDTVDLPLGCVELVLGRDDPGPGCSSAANPWVEDVLNLVERRVPQAGRVRADAVPVLHQL